MLPIWQTADDIDVFESGWTFDHFYPIFSDSTGPCLEGWITLTALAQATKRLRVGVLVTGIHYRHPAVLANMASALDVISNGRLELGIGAGWNEEESGAYGIELGTIKERFDRFEEACEVLTSLLTKESTTFDGKYYQLKDARNEPKVLSSRIPRSASAAAARSGPFRSPPSTPTTGTSSAGRRRNSPRSVTCSRPVARTSGATRRRSPSRRTSASARTATTKPWWRIASRWAPRVSTWRSSTCHRPTTRPSWNRWPRPSATRDCSRRPKG